MKRTAFCGLMLALALIASYVESLIPVPIPIPGIKLGVANSIVLILLYVTNKKKPKFREKSASFLYY